MPYVETVKIAGVEVVRGFAPPSIDPVATGEIVGPLLAADKVYLDHVELKAQLEACFQAQKTIWETWKTQQKNTPEWRASESAWKQKLAEQKIIQDQCRVQGGLVEERRRVLVEENAVRFTINGVHEISEAVEADLKTKLAEVPEGSVLLFDGSIVVNKIGEKYWTKTGDTWAETEITELGGDVPEGSFALGDLTDEQLVEVNWQIERNRILGLTVEARAEEKDQKLEEALAQSAIERSKYEIQGHPDPLGAAQDWYNARAAEIEILYAEPV